MKKVLALFLAAIISVSIVLPTLAAAEELNGNIIAGGWAEITEDDPEYYDIPEEVITAFDKAIQHYVGMNLEPVAFVGRQVVAGMNYKLLCVGAPVVLNPEYGLYYVTIYADLEGNAQITSVVEASDEEHGDPGWQHDENGWWYLFENGDYPVNQWLYYEGNEYYFDEDGYMYTGWLYLDDWYCFDSTGALVTGWLSFNDKWYYMDEFGAMATGWVYWNDSWYYMDMSGEMITGWLYYNDAWYYLESNGVMVTGPTEIDGVWNSFEENGTWIPFSSN